MLITLYRRGERASRRPPKKAAGAGHVVKRDVGVS